jgi:hypothetical protein
VEVLNNGTFSAFLLGLEQKMKKFVFKNDGFAVVYGLLIVYSFYSGVSIM